MVLRLYIFLVNLSKVRGGSRVVADRSNHPHPTANSTNYQTVVLTCTIVAQSVWEVTNCSLTRFEAHSIGGNLCLLLLVWLGRGGLNTVI